MSPTHFASLLLLTGFSWAGFLGPACMVAQQSPSSAPSLADVSGTDGSGARSERYVGDGACLSCHKDQSLPYLHTAHHLTSQLGNRESILGSFHEGSNVLTIIDPATANESPGLEFKMEAKEGGYYEAAKIGWPGRFITRTERMDVVIGSGTRGQTYLFWHGDQLYELPVSYWVDGLQWINSPGFDDGKSNFNRPIYPRCLECHATYIRPLSADPFTNRYDRSSLLVGISCETCHGPGAKHVALQRANAGHFRQPVDQAILNPAKFSRDRQVDLCALCHNGLRPETAPAFSYKLGEPLDNYLQPNPNDMVEHPDVHGNQVGLLKRSRCYLSSPNMTCSTCHDEHAPEKTAAAYSTKCLTCHQVESCGMSKTMGHKIAENCVDCHMPVEPTKKIVSVTAGRVVRAKMRSHWIRVYPQEGKAAGS